MRYRVTHRSAAARPGLTQVLDRMFGSSLVFHGDDRDLNDLFEVWFGDGELTIAETLSGLNQEPRSGVGKAFALNLLLKAGAISGSAMVIGPTGKPLAYETIAMTDGSGTKKKLSLSNCWVAGIRFGGQTAAKEIQPTVISCSGDDEEATLLFRQLKRLVTKRANWVSPCWVLPGAYDKLLQGWRLPGGQFQAPCTDLSISH